MKKIILLCFLTAIVVAVVSFDSKKRIAISDSKQIIQDSLEEDRAKYTKLIRESIKGMENMRADSVFKKIKMLKIPAVRLLAIMNIAYSRSLGVSCGHCHNTADFSSEEKRQKDVTRQMATMSRTINNDLLKNIKGLNSETAVINCTTCHRGEITPALDLTVGKK